jgi:hypothetical protein
MGTTFLKRQKEMKRLDKQKMKAERREQKKLANRAEMEAAIAGLNVTPESTESTESTETIESSATETQPQN